MNHYLWIAVAATLVVVLAHVGLFWWFLCKPRKDDPPTSSQDESKND